MSIRLENVTKYWRDPDGSKRCVLDVPELSLPADGQLCLVGASGSGKTTLLNIIAGIVRPSSGHVFFEGGDIAQLNEWQRDEFRARNVGYVFQTFNLLQPLTARENIAIALSFAGKGSREAQERANELLERVGLEHRADARPAQMSVGEQQRVAIARAIANKPQVVLADEPTANLDQENGAAILDLLRETTAEEKSVLLLVTHDVQVRERFENVRELEEIQR